MMQTLFSRIGGKDTVAKATHFLYVNIYRDERLRPFFENIDMQKQAHKMEAFLIYIFGGDEVYQGADLSIAHHQAVSNGLNDEHIDAMIECVCCTLQEMGINSNLIGEVAQKINQYRDQVLGRAV